MFFEAMRKNYESTIWINVFTFLEHEGSWVYLLLRISLRFYIRWSFRVCSRGDGGGSLTFAVAWVKKFMALQFLEWFNGIILKSSTSLFPTPPPTFVPFALSVIWKVKNTGERHVTRGTSCRILDERNERFYYSSAYRCEIISTWNILHRNYESLRCSLALACIFFSSLLYSFASVIQFFVCFTNEPSWIRGEMRCNFKNGSLRMKKIRLRIVSYKKALEFRALKR